MILEEYKFKDVFSYNGLKTTFHVLKYMNYKFIEVKNSKMLLKTKTLNNESIHNVIIYFDGEKYNVYLDEKSNIKYICKFASDYKTKVFEKCFLFGLNCEFQKLKDDKQIMEIVFLFYDLLTETFNKFKELNIE